MRIAILGATGLLGSTLVPYLEQRGHEVLTHGHEQDAEFKADLTRAHEVNETLNSMRPQTIVNLAALTNVDACERLPNAAYLVNVHIVENIAQWMLGNSGSHLIQISTDQLYDGEGPHSEGKVTISNHYGFSKYAGELAARIVPSTILRTNFVGRSRRSGRQSLSDWIAQCLMDREAITVFDDVFFSPISMDVLSSVIDLVSLERRAGVFNVGSRGRISKADFAFSLAKELGLSTERMTRGGAAGVNRVTRRPGDMSMDSSEFERAFGLQMPTVDQVIRSLRDSYNN